MEDLNKLHDSAIINQRLDFDEMSCDEEEDGSETGSGATISTNNSGLLRKKLNFDFVDNIDYHLEEEFDDTDPNAGLPSTDPNAGQSSKSSPVSKSSMPIQKKLRFCPNTSGGASGDILSPCSTPGGHDSGSSSEFSPCRTRSGRIYIAATSSAEKKTLMLAEKPKNTMLKPKMIIQHKSKSSPSRLPTPTFNIGGGVNNVNRAKELNLLQKDLSKMMNNDENKPPPPLNYSKRPVSRIHARPFLQSPASDPISPIGGHAHSPPTNEVKAMRLFDDSSSTGNANPNNFTSPVSAPRLNIRSRMFNFFENEDINRRVSAPAAGSNILAHPEIDQRKRKRTTNINPFTPTSLLATLRKKARMTSGESSESVNGSFDPVPLDTLAMQGFEAASAAATAAASALHEEDENLLSTGPAKRLKVSDINISRYEEEFVEIREIASGTFGTVKVARHRLDGMVYAIKVTRNKIHGNTHEERVAMNEVFAHSALIKHKHVVRYYNSWVENGRVYIQNEFCEGGSLAAKIHEFRTTGKRFTEAELKRILLHLAKGLDYIHSKLLVHLDVKPENIFIALDYPMRIKESNSPNLEQNANNANANSANNVKTQQTSTEDEVLSGNESTDSGHHSGPGKTCKIDSTSSSPVDDRVAYKIGDLGHVSAIHGDAIPEEGDCRYMAPELLEMHINRELLAKADIFSLGLTLFEAASLRELPKNSLEDDMYSDLKAGNLPYLDGYSKDFNNILKAMVSPDPMSRPSANRLASLQSLRGTNSSNNKSRSQLYQELKETKAKLRLLEQQLDATNIATNGATSCDTPKSTNSQSGRLLIGRGCAKSRSFKL